jgi:hypothetical protein
MKWQALIYSKKDWYWYPISLSDSSPLLAESLGIRWIIENKIQGIIGFL